MLTRVCGFALEHPITPEIPRATELFAEAASLKAAMLAHSGTQLYGRGGYRSGATERRFLADDLRTVLGDIAATARGLEPMHPGIADQFRLGRQGDSYGKLLATANAFLICVGQADVKALFTARAFPEDFDLQLQAKIAALAKATARKASGLQKQREGSAGLDILSRRVTVVMTELRALMVKYLRDRDETILAVWNSAARTYSDPVAAPASAAAPQGDGGTT